MNSNTTGVPNWKLERYLLEELPGDEMESLRQLEKTDAALQQRLSVLRQENAEILEQFPPAWMARQIRVRAGAAESGERQRDWLERLWPMPAVPVLGLLAVMALLPALEKNDDSPGREMAPAGIRIKGLEPQLILHRKTAAGSEQLSDGAFVTEGDLIQVQYRAAGAKYGAIVSIDGRRQVTRHLPSDARRAQELELAGPVALGFAYELDDAPDWERFYFVTSPARFDVDDIIAAVTAAAGKPAGDSLDVGANISQSALTLRKTPRGSGRQ